MTKFTREQLEAFYATIEAIINEKISDALGRDNLCEVIRRTRICSDFEKLFLDNEDGESNGT